MEKQLTVSGGLGVSLRSSGGLFLSEEGLGAGPSPSPLSDRVKTRWMRRVWFKGGQGGGTGGEMRRAGGVGWGWGLELGWGCDWEGDGHGRACTGPYCLAQLWGTLPAATPERDSPVEGRGTLDGALYTGGPGADEREGGLRGREASLE